MLKLDLTAERAMGGGEWFSPKQSTFPGGELFISLDQMPNEVDHSGEATVVTRLETSDDIVRLLLVNNALKNIYSKIKISKLIVPYISYGRQDRVMKYGEPLSLKVMADLINAHINPDVLVTADAHSDVTAALFDCKVIDIGFQLAIEAIYKAQPDIIIIPDAGASKKTEKYYGHLVMPKIQCLKLRDVHSQGKITKTSVLVESPDQLRGKKLFISDDICSGGKTFINIAEELRRYEPTEIILYVTHGIFNNKLMPLYESGISKIITTDSRSERSLTASDTFEVFSFFSEVSKYVD